jgi:phosphohistidine phosphatase
MKTLILLRHAKSSWSDPDMDDHDRVLNGRGRTAAPAMARWLETAGLVPERILCSSARRTQETVERMRKAVPALPEPAILPELYHASPETILGAIRGVADEVASVMVVGHEPSMSALAHLLDRGDAEPECRRAFAHFPTAAAAVFRIESEAWSGLGPRQASFAAFAVPREVMGER